MTTVQETNRLVQSRRSAWESIGKPVEDRMTVDEALVLADADFTARVEPLTVLSRQGGFQDEDGTWQGGELVPVTTDKFQVVRPAEERIGADGPYWEPARFFGTCHWYKPIQYRAVLDLAMEVADVSGSRVDFIGTRRKGERMFARIMGNPIVLDPGGVADELQPSLVVDAWHKPGRAVRIGQTIERMFCLNQFAGIMRRWSFSIVHSAQNANRGLIDVNDIRDQLTAIGEELAAATGRAEYLLATPATADTVRTLEEILWPKPEDRDESKRKANLRTARQERMLDVYLQEVERVGANRWAAIQAASNELQWNGKMAAESAVLGSSLPKRINHLSSVLLAD